LDHVLASGAFSVVKKLQHFTSCTLCHSKISPFVNFRNPARGNNGRLDSEQRGSPRRVMKRYVVGCQS